MTSHGLYPGQPPEVGGILPVPVHHFHPGRRRTGKATVEDCDSQPAANRRLGNGPADEPGTAQHQNPHLAIVPRPQAGPAGLGVVFT